MQARRRKRRKRKAKAACTSPSAGPILLDQVYLCLTLINSEGRCTPVDGDHVKYLEAVHWSRPCGQLRLGIFLDVEIACLVVSQTATPSHKSIGGGCRTQG